MPPQNNNYDFIMNNGKSTGGGFSQKQRIMQVVIGILILLLLFGVVYLLFFSGKKNDSQKLLPVYGSLLDIKDLSETAVKDLRNPDQLNQATTNIVIINSQLTELSKFMDKKSTTDKKIIANYRNNEYVKNLAEAKQNGTYEKSYSAILANRLDANKQIIVTSYSSVGNQNLKKLLERINSELGTANGEQTMPTVK